MSAFRKFGNSPVVHLNNWRTGDTFCGRAYGREVIANIAVEPTCRRCFTIAERIRRLREGA